MNKDHETSKSPQSSRKILCRYGRGCTHLHDSCHKAKYWHPEVPSLTGTVITAISYIEYILLTCLCFIR